MKRITLIAFVFCLISLSCMAQFSRMRNPMREQRSEYFKTEDARRVGDQILLYQRVTGGWPKNINMWRELSDKDKDAIAAQKTRTDDSTIDNGATFMQLNYLARLFNETKGKKYRDAFQKGIDFLLDGQYDNGGWPQFWPNPRGYQANITFNDDAIVNTLNIFKNITDNKQPLNTDLVTKQQLKRIKTAFDKGIDIILKTQIYVNGKPTVWCQQHDKDTFKPAHARAYELPSFCSQESAAIVALLMSLPEPDERIKQAVHGAMKWFDTYKITGLRLTRGGYGRTDFNTSLVADPNAHPLWARFYDLDKCEPYVCDRDGIPRKRLEELGQERRNGYSWYGDRPSSLYKTYNEWADKYDPQNKVALDISSKGANENGTFEMFTKQKINPANFDVIVNPGDSIQLAIEKAPTLPTEPFKILIRKGTYNQKIIIDRPNIVLVGENRDSTILVLAEMAKTNRIPEYHGKKTGNGVIVLQEGADDCIISGLTVYNNYGTTIENTTAHQMAIFGRATRTIVINCNVWADGNDALSLWAHGGNGMYYHADLDLRCPGVDFLCPRGWCYATRCKFYGDSRAIIWHDGRGDKNQKLVIKDSYFDAKTPTLLGRYHHDSQFFLIGCHLSKNILDTNICYAYSDKVLDPCPWGLRTYYYGCTREGGHSGWLNNNLDEAEKGLQFYAITAQWTFDGKWDPEKRIHDLWNVLAY